jgi:hypothetical protein
MCYGYQIPSVSTFIFLDFGTVLMCVVFYLFFILAFILKQRFPTLGLYLKFIQDSSLFNFGLDRFYCISSSLNKKQTFVGGKMYVLFILNIHVTPIYKCICYCFFFGIYFSTESEISKLCFKY